MAHFPSKFVYPQNLGINTSLFKLAFLQSFQCMMIRPALVLVATLLINILSYCSTEIVYCVTPTATSCSSCPHNSANCTTLSEYAREAELYFTSDTTIVFLLGDHVLDTNITVANGTRLTMRGMFSSGNRATVVCSGSVGLSFTSMVKFKIDSLAFASCSRKCAITLPYIPLATVHVALFLHATQYTELVNCLFHDNKGTALAVCNTNITLAGNTEFTRNHMLCGNFMTLGVIIAVGSNLTFTGNTNFLDNSAQCGAQGGAIYASDNTVLSFSGTSNFINNSADNVGGLVGGAIYTSNTVLNFSGTSNFINNSAISGFGGAILTSDNSALSFSGTSNFISNSAYGGGAIYTYNTVLNFSGTSSFLNNSAAEGGAIYTTGHTEISFSGTNNFISNSVGGDGGIIYTANTVLNFNGTSNFINNWADGSGGAFYTSTNNTLTFNGTVNFTNNICRGRVGVNRHAVGGGGVFIGLKNTFFILPNTAVYWENNHASFGGAIYVEDASPLSYCTSVATLVPKEECFFQLPGQNLSNGIDVQLVFKNNSADVAGSVLYGGAVDNCKLTHGLDSGKVFDMISHNDDIDRNTTSNISSDPLRICPCESNLPNCKSEYNVPHTVYPGETFQVPVVAVGQRGGVVPSRVISSISNAGDTLDSQYLQQQANNTCTALSYAVSSLSQYVEIDLHAEGTPCDDKLKILLTLNQTCPPGFNLSESHKVCVCEPRLAQYEVQCNITNGLRRITRYSGRQFWVGYDNQTDGLVLHPHCPFDYCVSQTVVFSLNNVDIQCAYNRSGLLCGACKKGYSLVLGTSQCWKCTNNHHLAFLIPFAVMGVALVFLLLVCKLTVATGMLNGLLFYVNIVEVNRNIFLPVHSTDAFSVFIAWLNLDWGIETCFYNGMDAYSKIWLQFAFPVYIWLLVGLIILVSRFSHRFANLLGNNPVSVLATLILLSYTKILRTLIAASYITFLQYPDHNRRVWLYDANVEYLSGKHIPLFLVAVLVFLFLFLPYTLLLLFGQWLQAISHLRLFSWVNSARLKPFMDSYHAPYKAKHRYWPGLLLVLRFALLLVFALNLQQDPSINLLAILVGTGILHLWAWISGGVYRNWCLDALEGSFALNLIILVGATSHVNYSKGNQLAVGYTSVSIALITFIGILVFQLANVTGIAQYLKCKAVTIRNQAEAEVEPLDNNSLPDRLINPEGYEPPFHTPQGHIAAEPTEGANEVQKRLITPVYTYGSID